MSMIRTAKRENPFVQIDKYFLEDDNLSFEAKGILAYVLSKPDSWTIRKNDLIKRSKSGRTRIESALLELMASGYLNWYQLRSEGGTFGEWVYDVYERPEFNPDAEKIMLEGQNRINKRKDKNKKRVTTTKDLATEKKEQGNPVLIELPSDMGFKDELKQPKAENQPSVSPKVENPLSDNPTSENQPYSNNVFSNNDFNNNELKKNDEEDYIYKLRNENLIYDFIFSYLTEKGLSEQTANDVIFSCDENNLDVVTANDVEKQYEHMMAKINNQETIYDFASYFVGGLMKKAEITMVNLINENEKAIAATTEDRMTVPFYNWLEDRG